MLLNPSPIAEVFGVITTDIEENLLDYPFSLQYNLGGDFLIADEGMKNIREWLVENISAPKRRWAIGHMSVNDNTVEYLFKLEEDVMAFKLRWL